VNLGPGNIQNNSRTPDKELNTDICNTFLSHQTELLQTFKNGPFLAHPVILYMEKHTWCMCTWATKWSKNAISSILKWWRERVASRQIGVGVVPTLVIVKLDIEFLQLGEVDAQCATAIVDVLPIQRLSTANITIGRWLGRH